LSNIRSSTITSSAGPSHAATPVASIPTNLLTSEQSLIAAELDIPVTMLCTGTQLSLQANYIRYLAYLEASQKLADITKAEAWPSGLKKPTSMDVILLFIGK
jgi:hypothetical protein